MHQGHKAYSNVAKQIQPPRELEASLLMRAASQLQQIYDNWEQSTDVLGAALTFDRDLWLVLVESATANENPLPQEIKNNIASLAVFIFSRIIEIETTPRNERDKNKLNVLISINRNIAAGLLAQPSAT